MSLPFLYREKGGLRQRANAANMQLLQSLVLRSVSSVLPTNARIFISIATCLESVMEIQFFRRLWFWCYNDMDEINVFDDDLT